MDKDALEHQRKLWEYFNNPQWEAHRKELEEFRADLVNYMGRLDVSLESQRIEHIRSKAQLDLVDIWLRLPEENKNFLEQMKDLFVSILN